VSACRAQQCNPWSAPGHMRHGEPA
jgi:hypothetical protein